MCEVRCEEWELRSCLEILKHVRQNGFTELIGCEYTKQKQLSSNSVAIWKKTPLVTTDRPISFRVEAEVLEAAQLIAGFHNAGVGFRRSVGMKTRTEWGRLVEKYRLMLTRMYRFFEREGPEDDFRIEANLRKTELLMRANSAERMFRSEGYLKLLEQSMQKREIGLINFHEENFTFVQNRLMLDTDVGIGYTMAVEDLALLLRRASIASATEQANQVIDHYAQMRGLSMMERELVAVLTDFPAGSIKCLLRYDRSNDMEVQLARFRKCCKQEAVKVQ